MYKKITILLSAAIMLCLAACGKAPKHYGMEAKTISFDSLEDMETFSEVIVRGIRMSGEAPTITSENENMVSGYTFSDFKVTELFKDTSNTLKKDSIITVLENEVYDEKENTVYHIAGYNMMVEGKEYLLFLDKDTLDNQDYYVSAGVNYGTISLQKDGRETERLTRDGNTVTDISCYEPIWDAAKEKFIK